MRPLSLFISFIVFFTSCKGQESFGTEKLTLVKEIPMPGVKGRIDHMALNQKDGALYVAALGNNSVEVIDLNKGTLIHTIRGIEEPQGIAYLPGLNEIAVASGSTGDCLFYKASTFEKISTLNLGSDADNIRYDASDRKLYVGYGTGGMAIIDPGTHKLIGNIKLPAHPEGFQLNKRTNKLYVNLPADHSIAVIDVKRATVSGTWRVKGYNANFPMTLDTENNLVLVGFRHPAVLVGYDGSTGKQVSTNELVSDVDDIFYEEDKQEVVASGGDGVINVFERETVSRYKKVANILTREGARTSLLIPTSRTFILAERATNGKDAAIAVYTIK